jgi:ferredoxin-NADP reductase
MAIETLQLRVRQITNEAEGINTFELVDPSGRELPEFSAGSHIDIHIPGNFLRQYSLCNNPQERHRYIVGVLNDPNSTGGSRSMHENVRSGDLVTVSYPRNNFPVRDEAKHHLLLAGGIGVTPMMAMIERLQTMCADFTMHYCTKSEEQTAFRGRLADLEREGRIVNHYDGGDPSKGLDIPELLKEHPEGTHLYYCGPTGFMLATKEGSAHWPSETVHFEYFAPVAMEKSTAGESVQLGDAEFQVTISSSGATYNIPADKSIVDVLRENGIDIDTSCEAGTCGTCKTHYLEGEPDHNDFVLTDAEQKEWVMVCCARSNSEKIVLDL